MGRKSHKASSLPAPSLPSASPPPQPFTAFAPSPPPQPTDEGTRSRKLQLAVDFSSPTPPSAPSSAPEVSILTSVAACAATNHQSSPLVPLAMEVQACTPLAAPSVVSAKDLAFSSVIASSPKPSSAAAQPSVTIPPAEVAGSQPKLSWTDVVQGSGQKMSKRGTPFKLDTGELCVKIPNSVIHKNKKCWDNFIIGQFHGKPPSPGTLHAIANGIWSNRLRDITVSHLTDKAFLIRIPNAATRERVLAQGMWHIDNQSMFVAKWEPGLSPQIPELTSVPVWLEFRNVPLQYFNSDGFDYIAGLVGDPKFLHPTTANMTNLEVAKVFTIVDPTQPLPETITIQFESGEYHAIEVSSPWLPPTCKFCKAIGHSIKHCSTAPITCTICNSSGHDETNCTRSKQAFNQTKRKEQERKSVYQRPNQTADEVKDSFPTLKETTSKPKPIPKPSSGSLAPSSAPGTVKEATPISKPVDSVWVKKHGTNSSGIRIVTPPDHRLRPRSSPQGKGKEIATHQGYDSSDAAGYISGYTITDSSGTDSVSGDDDNPADSEKFIPYVSKKLMRQLKALRKKQTSRGSGTKNHH